MTETLTNTNFPAPESAPVFNVPPELAFQPSQREGTLRNLLGTDYDYANQIGLIDMFQYDPATGEDGLMHTLTGLVVTGEDEARVAMGFHHEPSARLLWETGWQYPDQTVPLAPTRVDRSHLEDANARTRAEFKELPFEPYKARVTIDNVRKLGTGLPDADGVRPVVESKTLMYPKEYDPMAVLQTIRIAYGGRDASTEQPLQDHYGRPVIVSEGTAPMLDGVTPMRIRFVLDPQTNKIITAIPLTKPGALKLSPDAIKQHLGL